MAKRDVAVLLLERQCFHVRGYGMSQIRGHSAGGLKTAKKVQSRIVGPCCRYEHKVSRLVRCKWMREDDLRQSVSNFHVSVSSTGEPSYGFLLPSLPFVPFPSTITSAGEVLQALPQGGDFLQSELLLMNRLA